MSKHDIRKKRNLRIVNLIYHQTGLALDFVPYINGAYTWQNEQAFLAIAKTAFQVWDNIPDKKGMFLHWGGFWRAEDLNFNGLLNLDD